MNPRSALGLTTVALLGLAAFAASRACSSDPDPKPAQNARSGEIESVPDRQPVEHTFTGPGRRPDTRTDAVPPVTASAAIDDVSRSESEPAERLVLDGLCLERITRAPIAGAIVASSDERTETATDGTFALTFPPEQPVLRFELQHADHVQLSVEVSRDEVPTAPARFEVLLSTGIPVSLEVVDSMTGAPIADAVWQSTGMQVLASTSNAQGRLRWTVEVGAEVEGEFSAAGYCDTNWSWTAADEGLQGAVVPLVPVAWLEGTVTDDAGLPLADAYVGASRARFGLRRNAELTGERWRDALPPGTLSSFFIHGDVRADAQGAWVLPVWPSEHGYVLSVMHPGFVPRSFPDQVLESPGERRRIDVRLTRGGIIAGSVVRNGEPWSGTLQWKPVSEQHARYTSVSDGAYRIEGVPAGTIELRIEARRTQEAFIRTTVEVTLGEAVTHDLEWAEAVGTISGTVVRTGGGPLGEVRVFARPSQQGPSFDVPSYGAACRDDGTFEIEVPENGLFEVGASDRIVRAEPVSAASGARDVQLELGVSGTLTIRLVDAASGEPITSDLADVLSWGASGSHLRPVFDQRPKEGRMTLNAPVGSIDLEIDLVEDGYVAKRVEAVRVSAEPTTLDIVMQPCVDVRLAFDEAAVAALDGHILYLLKEGGEVRLVEPYDRTRKKGMKLEFLGGAHEGSYLTVEGSTARMTGLEPGRYVLQAVPDDLRFEPAVIVLEPGLAKVEVALAR